MVQILLMPAKPTMMYTMCHLSVNFIFFVSFFAFSVDKFLYFVSHLFKLFFVFSRRCNAVQQFSLQKHKNSISIGILRVTENRKCMSMGKKISYKEQMHGFIGTACLQILASKADN